MVVLLWVIVEADGKAVAGWWWWCCSGWVRCWRVEEEDTLSCRMALLLLL